MVGLGGMIGSMLRYATTIYMKNQPFPYATFAINLAGCFVIGAIAGYALRDATFNSEWRLFLATGICGGFTTFSSFSLECLQLLQQNRFLGVVIYVGASVILGVAGALAGWMLTK
jgi:fluoride exporter